MSRTSLLDIFLMFWVLAAFGALLMDRDDGRRRLAARLGTAATASRVDGLRRPSCWRDRGWGSAGGASPPASAWAWPWGPNGPGLFFLAGFGLLTVLWDLNARRVGGNPRLDQRRNHQGRPAGLPQHGSRGRRWSTPPRGPAGSVPTTPTSGTGPRPTPPRSGAGCRTPSGPWPTTIWRRTSSIRGWARNTRMRQAPGAGW